MHAIYYIADENMADLAGAAALQTLLHWDCDVHIFVERRNPSAEIRMFENERITYHHDTLSGLLPADLPEWESWPRIVLARFLAPLLLPGYQRLLYLDADVLAFGADPALWQVPLPSGLGAVADLTMLRRRISGDDRANWIDEIGVRSGRYANSGVLLIDPEIWNRIDFASQLPAYFRKYPMATFPDQDFLAHVFDGIWTELSPRFNWQGGELYLGLTHAVAPCFVHFTGKGKPWHGPARWIEPRDPAYIAIYNRVLRYAGLDPEDFRKKQDLPAFSRAKYALREWGGQHSLRSKKQRCSERNWLRDRELTREYIENGLSEGRFAADRRNRLEITPPKTLWDGRFVRALDDLPPGQALPSVAAR